MSRSFSVVVMLLAALPTMLAGCSDSTEAGTGILGPEDVGSALRGLPFKTHVKVVKAPAGDDAAFIGTAERAGVVVRFSIGVGDSPVPIPGVGSARAIGEGSLGFIFNTDGNYVHAFKTGVEWYKAADTATAIEEQLCKKISGEPCPV